MTAPFKFPALFEGGSLHPLDRFRARVREEFIEGHTYTIQEAKERSDTAHKSYFGAIKHAWLNLPEHLANEPWAATADHLRAFALIMTGQSKAAQIVLSSESEAQRVAQFMRRTGPGDYAVFVVEGSVITRFDPISQACKAMGKHEFNQSRQKVLEYLAGLIGCAAKDLIENARSAA